MPMTYEQIVEVGRKMRYGDIETCLTEFVYDRERLAQLNCDIEAARGDFAVEVMQQPDFSPDTLQLFCCSE